MSGKKLPVYRIVMNDDPESDVEVNYVALVDRPAIERDFQTFNKQAFAFSTDDERRILSGPAMLANIPLYRDTNGEQFYVVFEKEEIEKIVTKFFQKGYQNNVNLMHNESKIVDGVIMFESFIVDSARGILPMKGYEDAQDGSWFVSYKVNNDDVWNSIKEGKFKGFSVEGIFGRQKVDESEQELLNELQTIVGEDAELFQQIKQLLQS